MTTTHRISQQELHTVNKIQLTQKKEKILTFMRKSLIAFKSHNLMMNKMKIQIKGRL